MIKKNEINIGIVSNSDFSGGAARAAFRLCKALNFESESYKLTARLHVVDARTGSKFVLGPTTTYSKYISRAKSFLSNLLSRLIMRDQVLHSLSLFKNRRMVEEINREGYDVVNIHWHNHETLSLSEFKDIQAPIILTMHDMWAVGSTSHLGEVISNNDIVGGNKIEKLIKIHTINKKKMAYKHVDLVVSPSQWLSVSAKESIFFDDTNIAVIPNPIDINIFKPCGKHVAQNLLNLSVMPDSKIIGFGALGSRFNHNKGFDLLLSSINEIKNINDISFEVVIFGQEEPQEMPLELEGVRCHFLGRCYDDVTLNLIYNSLDAFIVPSRIENLPQTAIESFCCGVPVIAFETTGLLDIIEHKENGYLAKPYVVNDLCEGIKWILSRNSKEYEVISKNARHKAIAKWQESIVRDSYVNSIIELTK